ncbi:ferritin-like domain-containing protein [Nonomuraea angiospora]|uniref:ferritin-like domain-containing protein n=1 Tax=Nonomuraea angiospora TaxID=46172 RepID=UPI0029A47DEE|nr:ferritin-like protein [Nonomuraea angiospora]MDX3103152.1 ferritin-like protein [Nonomuraea angiospora]
MTEPPIVIEHREHVWYLLVQASQLEHMIMCQYLFAEFSLKTDGLTEEQQAAVDRWRQELHGIAVQEMLHLALVANLMSSIGAAPTFGRPNFPQSSGAFPPSIQLRLLPFGEAALAHFLYLERPEGMDRHDAAEFISCDPPPEPVATGEIFPRAQEFATVGHLYRGIKDGLTALVAKYGEEQVFCGSPRAQATPELFRWPEMVAVTDLASACAAIEEIIEQGEGAQGAWQDAHYGRFLKIWEEYHALRAADPSFEPAHPALGAFTRQPFDVREPQPLIGDPRTLALAELCNLAYEAILWLLTRYFTHTDESEEELDVLISAAITTMAAVLRPLGTELCRRPAGPAHPGRTAGPAFEMYYLMDNLVPWREAAWTVLVERLRQIAERCASHAATDPVIAQASEQVTAVADALDAVRAKAASGITTPGGTA